LGRIPIAPIVANRHRQFTHDTLAAPVQLNHDLVIRLLRSAPAQAIEGYQRTRSRAAMLAERSRQTLSRR
jgi:hypothetical protein